MRIGKAILLVMRKWQITHYRLSQASGVGESTIGKLVIGQLESTSWDNVEKLANGFEQIDPMAKDAFMGVLQRPDGIYPGLSGNVVDLAWDRELPENIAAVIAALNKYKLLDRENIKKLQAKLAEQDAKAEITIHPTTIEDFIGSVMMHTRRKKQGGSAQDA